MMLLYGISAAMSSRCPEIVKVFPIYLLPMAICTFYLY